MASTPRSFIREILKVTEQPDIISFAVGLSKPSLIDVEGIRQASESVLRQDGRSALQYSTTEGYLPLRQFIADRYKKRLGLSISPSEILITNGSQQCLDLIGKVMIDAGDPIGLERPGYLGAIQAFSQYQPEFHAIQLTDSGPDMIEFDRQCGSGKLRFFYGIPNSQNPSGITYSATCRQEIGSVLAGTDTLFVEDDAYGELDFFGRSLPSLWQYLPEQTIITGSFSKIMAPGMRLGWVVAPCKIMEQLIIAKQASDLHSNFLSQRIAGEYLRVNDIDAHIRTIQHAYRHQCDLMFTTIKDTFPESVTCTKPRGGMFIWLTLPDGCSSMDLFGLALREKVAVLPGIPFYLDGGGTDTIRLNFSNATDEQIVNGITRLAAGICSISR
jgi:2-aminoadipate transaminase